MIADTQKNAKWTLKSLLEWTTDHLTKSHIDQPRLCAEILLAHVLNTQRIDLYLQFERCPTDQQRTQFGQLVRRCADHEPVGYLTGEVSFFNLKLQVGPEVLIPRPETETLVLQAIEFLRHSMSRSEPQVLDVGTGSGCVALAIAENVIEAQVIAIDNSAKALKIAQNNINKYDLQDRVTLLQSDLFNDFAQSPVQLFDLIVSNPPYIGANEFDQLPSMVRDYEPREALFAGDDGLEVHRRIIQDAKNYLADDAKLMLEVAYNQADAVIALLENSGYFDEISAVKDNLGHRRVIQARKTFGD